MPLLDNYNTSNLTYQPCCKVWTQAWHPITLESASSTPKTHFNRAGKLLAINLQWLSGLVPILRNIELYLGGLCFLHLVDPVEGIIWTACLAHWNDVTGIAATLFCIYWALLRQWHWWLWSTYSVKLAYLLKQQAMLFCCSPSGIAHHSAKSSRVLICGHSFCIVY